MYFPRKLSGSSVILINSFKSFPLGTAANFSNGVDFQNSKQPSDIKVTEYNEKEKSSTTFLELFASKKNKFMEWHKYNPLTMTAERYRDWRAKTNLEAEILDQRFIKERLDLLGNDLAAAHFIVFRNGKVRFKDSDKWIEKSPDEELYPELPKKFVRNMYLEAIDASNTKIRYEGLVNFKNLSLLKWLSFSNCQNVDDWFVDRLSGEVKDTLEFLNLSNCTNLSMNCLSCFYRFKKLKRLLLHNVVNNKEFEFSCMLLEDVFPDLIITY